jgi:hypothetical protein
VYLQILKTSIDAWTRSLDNITNVKAFHEVIANMRNGLLNELVLILQVEAKTAKAEMRISQEMMEAMEAKFEATRREFQTQLKEVEARTERGRGEGTGAAKPPKFDGNTSWVVFRRHFETVTEHYCWARREKSTYLITAL